MPTPVLITECPRDAMQGIVPFIPTALKVEYLNALLQVGFHTLDFGSFVSPKAIPQLADTHQVLPLLHNPLGTELLAIVLNERGAQDALQYPQIDVLGFPWSISPTFQLRNGNQTPEQAWQVLSQIALLTQQAGRKLRVYISMGFGNPYGDEWSAALVAEAIHKIKTELGVQEFALADTVGAANPADIDHLFRTLRDEHPSLTLGAHFHVSPNNWHQKVAAAWGAGCRHFDVALGGFGGCPFANDKLVGNLDTMLLQQFLDEQGQTPSWNAQALAEAQQIAQRVFALATH
jgi:hydroxymethylglutaryl-CoA lyase